MANPPSNQFDSNIRSVIPRYDELLEDFYEERRKVKELQAINAQLQQRKEALEFIVERQERMLYAFTDRRKAE